MPSIERRHHLKNENIKQETPGLGETNATTHPMQSENFLRLLKNIQADGVGPGTSEVMWNYDT